MKITWDQIKIGLLVIIAVGVLGAAAAKLIAVVAS
jgi:hypothetical protein